VVTCYVFFLYVYSILYAVEYESNHSKHNTPSWQKKASHSSARSWHNSWLYLLVLYYIN